MSEESRKAYLEKRMEAVMRKWKVGRWLVIAGLLLGIAIFMGFLEALRDVDISELHWTIGVLSVISISPVLIVLGICIMKYYDNKHSKLVEEWKKE